MANWNGLRRFTSASGRPFDRLIVAAWCACVLPALAAPSQTVILDRILAIVNGQVIMQSDVRAFIELRLVESPPGPTQESEVLSYLIERRLVLDQVDRFSADPARELVDEQMRIVRDRFAGDAELASVLERVGLTSTDLRQLLADDLRRDLYLANRFGATDAGRRAEAQAEWVSGLVRRGQVRRVADGSP